MKKNKNSKKSTTGGGGGGSNKKQPPKQQQQKKKKKEKRVTLNQVASAVLPFDGDFRRMIWSHIVNFTPSEDLERLEGAGVPMLFDLAKEAKAVRTSDLVKEELKTKFWYDRLDVQEDDIWVKLNPVKARFNKMAKFTPLPYALGCTKQPTFRNRGSPPVWVAKDGKAVFGCDNDFLSECHGVYGEMPNTWIYGVYERTVPAIDYLEKVLKEPSGGGKKKNGKNMTK